VDEDQDEVKERFRVIEGYLGWPRPKPASWPRRYKRLKRVRSERRRRSGSFQLETRLKIGSVIFVGWRGEGARFRGGTRGRRPWGSLERRREARVKAPPYRQMAREQGQKLQAATKEETREMIRDAWDTVMGLREGKGIDPETWWKIQRECWGGFDPNG
jgi:hypothetical protein